MTRDGRETSPSSIVMPPGISFITSAILTSWPAALEHRRQRGGRAGGVAPRSRLPDALVLVNLGLVKALDGAEEVLTLLADHGGGQRLGRPAEPRRCPTPPATAAAALSGIPRPPRTRLSQRRASTGRRRHRVEDRAGRALRGGRRTDACGRGIGSVGVRQERELSSFGLADGCLQCTREARVRRLADTVCAKSAAATSGAQSSTSRSAEYWVQWSGSLLCVPFGEAGRHRVMPFLTR